MFIFFFFKQKMAYELRISDWSSDVCSSDLPKYDFVVLDIGENQGVLERAQMLVNRDGKLIGKIQITQVEPNRSIANVLQDWKQEEIMEGDQEIGRASRRERVCQYV